MLDREHVTDAIKFWERARIPYNLALMATSLVILIRMGMDTGTWMLMSIPLFLLAALANALYCVAYPVDLLAQASDFREGWRLVRWGVWALGTLVASVLTYLTLGGPYVFGFPGGPHG